MGYTIGDPVTAKFIVDFKGDGYLIMNDGQKLIPQDPPVTNDPHSYFFSVRISGFLMPVINGGYYNAPTNIKEYQVGYDSSGPMNNLSILQGGSDNSGVSIVKEGIFDTTVQNWIIGEHFVGIYVGSSNTGPSIMGADMILTNIQHRP